MQHKNYTGSPFLGEHIIDTELVEQVVGSMQRGKAAGLDDLSTEHLTPVILLSVIVVYPGEIT